MEPLTARQKRRLSRRVGKTIQSDYYTGAYAEHWFIKPVLGQQNSVTPGMAEKAQDGSGSSEVVDRVAQAARDSGSSGAALVMLQQLIEGKGSK